MPKRTKTPTPTPKMTRKMTPVSNADSEGGLPGLATQGAQLKACYASFCREQMQHVARNSAVAKSENDRLTKLHHAGKIAAPDYIKAVLNIHKRQAADLKTKDMIQCGLQKCQVSLRALLSGMQKVSADACKGTPGASTQHPPYPPCEDAARLRKALQGSKRIDAESASVLPIHDLVPGFQRVKLSISP